MKSILSGFAFAVPVLAGCAAGTPDAQAGAGSPATQFLARQEGRIAYDDTGGTGPLIVAVPSMGDLRGEYRHLTPILSRAGYRVVTLDVRGFGQSSASWGDYSAHAVGQDVLALIDHLGAGPAVVVGTSFAAGSAVWAAHDAPDKVRGVIMIGPVVHDLPSPFFVRAAIAIGFAGPWRVSFWTWYWNGLFPMQKPADHDVFRADLAANLREPGRMEALRTMVSLSKADTDAIVGTNHQPTLIIMGTQDQDFEDPVAEARTLAARTGAETFIIEGGGHYPQAETPDRTAARIVEFLATTP